MGFALIADILSSSFSEEHRYQIATFVVELLGNFLESWDYVVEILPAWMPPLLDFFFLSEKFYAAKSQPYPGSILLRILLAGTTFTDLGPAILPILSSVLLPTHPLQSRRLALKVFNECLPAWFSIQMQSVAVEDLNNLLHAVGDPFLFTWNTSLPNLRTLPPESDYEPIRAAVILITFASSNPWRDYLHPSNFTTCEEFLSTGEGKRVAIIDMFTTVRGALPRLFWTAEKVAAAIERLEELQCLNTAEVVIMWAWTVGVLDVEDHDSWGMVERSAVSFYQTHGIGRLKGLKQHLTNNIPYHSDRLFRLHQNPLCRGARAQQLAPPGSLDQDAYIYISQVCQLRRLYYLFGHGPTTREERAADEEVGDEMDLSLTATPASFVDWACDYP